MNTLNANNSVSKPKSIFPNGQYLDGLGVNHKTTFLHHVLKEYVGGGNKHKHMLLQEVVFYFCGNDLELYLQQNGYELLHTSDTGEDLQYIIKKQPQLRKQIISGEVNISLVYNDVYPEKIVLAKRVISESEVQDKINTLRDEIKNISGDILGISL